MASIRFFSDLPLNFIPNPTTGDVRPVNDAAAVKSSLINLLRTEPGSRPYRPTFGIDLARYLFQPSDPITEMELNEEIADAIQRFEPRATLVAIDSVIGDYDIQITIEFYVTGVSELQILNTTVSRTK